MTIRMTRDAYIAGTLARQYSTQNLSDADEFYYVAIGAAEYEVLPDQYKPAYPYTTARDSAGNVIGQTGPDGHVFTNPYPAENSILLLGDSITARGMRFSTISSASFSGTQMTLTVPVAANFVVGGYLRLYSRSLRGTANGVLEGTWPIVAWNSSTPSVTVELGFDGTGLNPGTGSVFATYAKSDVGWMHYAYSAATLAGKRLTLNNQAIGGDRVSDLKIRLPDIIAADSSNRAAVLIGINDIQAINGTTITLDTIIANYQDVVDQLIAAGYLVDLCSVWPLGATHSDYAGKTTYIKQLNGWLRHTANSTAGVTYIDQWAALIDGSNDYALAINLSTDEIHPAPRGAVLAGAAYYTAISGQLQKSSYDMVRSSIDGYDITPTGWNLISNPLLTGTGGTAGTGVTGDIPDDWSVSRSAGDSCVCALSAHSSGIGQDLQVTHNRSAATQTFTISQDVTTQCPAGTVVSAGCEIEVMEDEGGGAHYCRVYLACTTPTGSEFIAAQINAATYAQNGRVPATGTRYWYETPAQAIPAGTTAVVFTVLCAGGSVGDGTSADQTAIKMGRPVIRLAA